WQERTTRPFCRRRWLAEGTRRCVGGAGLDWPATSRFAACTDGPQHGLVHCAVVGAGALRLTRRLAAVEHRHEAVMAVSPVSLGIEDGALASWWPGYQSVDPGAVV